MEYKTDEERLKSIAGINPESCNPSYLHKIGYMQAAELAREAMEKNQSIRELVIIQGNSFKGGSRQAF